MGVVMKMLKTVQNLGCLAALVIAAQVQPLGAQGPSDALLGPLKPHPAADEAIARLKSPYCPGQMLEVCTSYTGALLRDSMQAMAREGWTTDELVDWMLANHGGEYLAYPAVSGTGTAGLARSTGRDHPGDAGRCGRPTIHASGRPA